MPFAADLPTTLATLANRQALELRPSHFADDIGRLVRVLDKTLPAVASPPVVRTEPEEPTSSVPAPPLRPPSKGPILTKVAVLVIALVLLVQIFEADPYSGLVLVVLGAIAWALWKWLHK